MAAKHYTGSCQCGAVAFEVEADLDRTITCNCSRCRRLGCVMTFVAPSDFHLKADGETREYLFNKKAISHRFCPACGIEPFARGVAPDGNEMIVINVNCLGGVDPGALDSRPVDGASL